MLGLGLVRHRTGNNIIQACYSSLPLHDKIVSCLIISTPTTPLLSYSLRFVFFACRFFVKAFRRGWSCHFSNPTFPSNTAEAKIKVLQSSVVVYHERQYPSHTHIENLLAHTVHAPHVTSIPLHSNTRNKLQSNARARPTLTTCAQNVVPSSVVARVAAGPQSPKSSRFSPDEI